MTNEQIDDLAVMAMLTAYGNDRAPIEVGVDSVAKAFRLSDDERDIVHLAALSRMQQLTNTGVALAHRSAQGAP